MLGAHVLDCVPLYRRAKGHAHQLIVSDFNIHSFIQHASNTTTSKHSRWNGANCSEFHVSFMLGSRVCDDALALPLSFALCDAFASKSAPPFSWLATISVRLFVRRKAGVACAAFVLACFQCQCVCRVCMELHLESSCECRPKKKFKSSKSMLIKQTNKRYAHLGRRAPER